MIRRAALAAFLVPATLALAAPTAPSYAAAVCQGRTATIESVGTVTGTEGDDVIVVTGGAASIDAKGGNDTICLDGGYVATGAGDDAVLSTAPAGEYTEVTLTLGADSYTNAGAGSSAVTVRDLTAVQVSLGAGDGRVYLDHTTVPGTGAVDVGTGDSFLFADGESEAFVDLAAGIAGVDGLLQVSIAHVRDASARGRVARIVGDDRRNDLHAAGCRITMEGGDGRDELTIVSGSDADRALNPFGCRQRSRLLGQGGPDVLDGRGGNDVLLGGKGRDKAFGSSGRDRCVAEVEKNCER